MNFQLWKSFYPQPQIQSWDSTHLCSLISLIIHQNLTPLTFDHKLHKCCHFLHQNSLMQHEFQHEYPILEFELITSFKILAYLHLNFSREHKHMQPQTYLCMTVKIFYYFTTNQPPNWCTCNHQNSSFLRCIFAINFWPFNYSLTTQNFSHATFSIRSVIFT